MNVLLAQESFWPTVLQTVDNNGLWIFLGVCGNRWRTFARTDTAVEISAISPHATATEGPAVRAFARSRLQAREQFRTGTVDMQLPEFF